MKGSSNASASFTSHETYATDQNNKKAGERREDAQIVFDTGLTRYGVLA